MPKLVGQQGNQLIYQNDDGSTFPVAANALSSDYLGDITKSLAQRQRPVTSADQPAFENYSGQEKFGVPPASIAAPDPTVPNSPLLTNIVNPKDAPIVPPAPPVQQKIEPTEIEKAFTEQASGISKEYKAIAEGAKQAAQEYEKNAAQIQAAQERVKLIQEDGAKIAQDSMKRIYDKQVEIENMKIENPFANASTATKIGAAIVIGMGEQAAAFLGRENTALNIINKAIDDDVKLQLRKIDKASNDLTNKNNYLGLVKSATNDKVLQELMLKDLGLQAAEQKIKMYGETTNSKVADAKRQQILGGLGMERQKAEDAAFKRTVEISAELAKAKLGGADSESFVPGLGVAYSKEDAKTLRQLSADINGANRGIDRLVALTKQSGKSLSPSDIAEAKALQQTLIGQLRTAIIGPGTINESERALLENIIANPTKFFSLDKSNIKTLDTLKETLKNKLDSAGQAQIQGYQPGSYKSPEIRTLPNGAQFQIVNGQPIPLNDQARMIEQAKKAQQSGR